MPIMQGICLNNFLRVWVDQGEIGVFADSDSAFPRNPEAFCDSGAQGLGDFLMRECMIGIVRGINHQRQKMLAARNSTPDLENV